MPVVLRIVGLVQGGETPFDGQYLLAYDPNQDGLDPRGVPMTCIIKTTPSVTFAKKFPTVMEALELWKQVDTRQPRRPDGLPNRPLTAFTVEMLDISAKNVVFAGRKGDFGV